MGDLLLVAGAHIGVEDDLLFFLRGQQLFQLVEAVVSYSPFVGQDLR